MNPMLQHLQKQSNPLGTILGLKRMMAGDPTAAANMLMQQNPQLAAFVRENSGKDINALCAQYGIDPNQIAQLLK